jgi:hypothetical protein
LYDILESKKYSFATFLCSWLFSLLAQEVSHIVASGVTLFKGYRLITATYIADIFYVGGCITARSRNTAAT